MTVPIHWPSALQVYTSLLGSVLQYVHHWCCLLPLEEVYDADQVVEEAKAGVHRAALPPRSAHTLAVMARYVKSAIA